MDYSKNILNILSQYNLLNKIIIDKKINTKLNISDDKWSVNQIIGHLIDSCCNNHQRIVRLKNDIKIQFSDYDKDIWLKNQNHNGMDFENLYILFYNYNILLAEIIKDINEKQKKNIWEIKWGDKNEITLEDLIKHYIEHLKIHYEHLSKRIEEIKNI
jgi:hypothetical protein